jgi:polyhydroxyalkanoic acid synthase PhaR subunit
MSESTDNNKDPGPKKAERAQPADPFEAWRKLRDSSLEMWSKSMIETVNSDAYAKMTGEVLDAYLTASGPFREAVTKSMLQALQQMNLPTREDFESLADRMTNIEMRLDDLDAKLEGRPRKQGGK